MATRICADLTSLRVLTFVLGLGLGAMDEFTGQVTGSEVGTLKGMGSVAVEV